MRLSDMWIPIINLGRSDDRLRFKMDKQNKDRILKNVSSVYTKDNFSV